MTDNRCGGGRGGEGQEFGLYRHQGWIDRKCIRVVGLSSGGRHAWREVNRVKNANAMGTDGSFCVLGRRLFSFLSYHSSHLVSCQVVNYAGYVCELAPSSARSEVIMTMLCQLHNAQSCKWANHDRRVNPTPLVPPHGMYGKRTHPNPQRCRLKVGVMPDIPCCAGMTSTTGDRHH